MCVNKSVSCMAANETKGVGLHILLKVCGVLACVCGSGLGGPLIGMKDTSMSDMYIKDKFKLKISHLVDQVASSEAWCGSRKERERARARAAESLRERAAMRLGLVCGAS